MVLSENLMPRAWTQGLCVGLNLSSVPEGTKLGALLLLGTSLGDDHRDIQLPRLSLEAVTGGLRCHSGLAGGSEPLGGQVSRVFLMRFLTQHPVQSAHLAVPLGWSPALRNENWSSREGMPGAPNSPLGHSLSKS